MSEYLMFEPPVTEYDLADQLMHHGILGMKWGVRRFQPYGPGQKVKGGKEVGLATKVKQRATGIADGIKQHKVKAQKAKTAKKAQATRKANADYAAAKKKAIESGTIEDLAKFKGDLTNEEYGRAFMRLQNEKKMSEMVAANQKTVWDTIDKGMDIAKKLTGYANTVADFKEKTDRLSDVLNKKSKEEEDKKKDRAKNAALTSIESITDLDRAQKEHNLTADEYSKGLKILQSKLAGEKAYDKDFEGRFTNQDRKAEREKAAAEKAANDEARAKMNAERDARKADKAYEKARNNATKGVMDGEWYQSGAKGVKGSKWVTKDPSEHAKDVARNTTVHYKEVGTNKTGQLMLTMKDATPSSYGSDKRTISGAKSGSSGTVKNTGTMSFGGKTTLYKKATGTDSGGKVAEMRKIIEETQEGKKKRKNYKP